MGFPCGSAGKESVCNAGDLGSISGLGRFPGEGKGYPLQYSGLENSMNCIVHEITKSQTLLSDFHLPKQKIPLKVWFLFRHNWDSGDLQESYHKYQGWKYFQDEPKLIERQEKRCHLNEISIQYSKFFSKSSTFVMLENTFSKTTSNPQLIMFS